MSRTDMKRAVLDLDVLAALAVLAALGLGTHFGVWSDDLQAGMGVFAIAALTRAGMRLRKVPV